MACGKKYEIFVTRVHERVDAAFGSNHDVGGEMTKAEANCRMRGEILGSCGRWARTAFPMRA